MITNFVVTYINEYMKNISVKLLKFIQNKNIDKKINEKNI